MSEIETSETGSVRTPEFGQSLRLAREQASMTIAEVAAALNLPEDMVEAIENSDVDNLPPPAFVQGYLRNYARYLDVDEQMVLDHFERDVPHKQETSLSPRSPLPPETHSGTPAMRTVTALVAIVAVLIVIYAVYSYYSQKNSEIELARSDETRADLAVESSPIPPIKQDARVTEDGRLFVDVPVPLPPETAIDADATETVPETSMTAPESVIETSIEEPEATDPAAEPESPVDDRLVLTAQGESWVKVTDADDNRLYIGQIRAGRELELAGRAPFGVTLGNAPAVEVSINAVRVDMTNYVRSNNIARFRVSSENGEVRFH